MFAASSHKRHPNRPSSTNNSSTPCRRGMMGQSPAPTVSRSAIMLCFFTVLVFLVVFTLDLKYEFTAAGDALAASDQKELGAVVPPKQSSSSSSLRSSSSGAATAGGGAKKEPQKHQQKKQQEQHKDATKTITSSSSAAALKARGKAPIEGTVNGMPYLHCPAHTKNNEKKGSTSGIRNVVLLHGMKFTHTIWKETGILASLCNVDSLQVTALDFDVKSNYKILKDTLQALHKEKLVTSLPIDILVTPSASGKSVVSWLNQQKRDDKAIQELPKFMKIWMPIAAPSVRNVDEATLAAVRGISSHDKDGHFSVVAVHGDQDNTMGKQTSEMLEKHSGATVVELKGGHAVYRDSPDDFVVTLRKQLHHLQQEETNNNNTKKKKKVNEPKHASDSSVVDGAGSKNQKKKDVKTKKEESKTEEAKKKNDKKKENKKDINTRKKDKDTGGGGSSSSVVGAGAGSKEENKKTKKEETKKKENKKGDKKENTKTTKKEVKKGDKKENTKTTKKEVKKEETKKKENKKGDKKEETKTTKKEVKKEDTKTKKEVKKIEEKKKDKKDNKTKDIQIEKVDKKEQAAVA